MGGRILVLRISLKWFLIVVVVSGAAIGLFSRQVLKQRAIVHAVRSNGGIALYDYELEDPIPGTCLEGVRHSDLVADVVWVRIWDPHEPIDDHWLQMLAGLKGLRRLEIVCPQATDDGLLHLNSLRKLEVVELRDAAVTDQAIARLKAAIPHCEVTRAE
jgi:hypothetical protein